MNAEDFTALPIPDRIRLVQAIWDSIVAEEPQSELTDEQVDHVIKAVNSF